MPFTTTLPQPRVSPCSSLYVPRAKTSTMRRFVDYYLSASVGVLKRDGLRIRRSQVRVLPSALRKLLQNVQKGRPPIISSGPSQEVVVRPPVGKQPDLPEEHATKLPRAADTLNFANHNIKRLVAELPPTDRNGAPPIRLKKLLVSHT